MSHIRKFLKRLKSNEEGSVLTEIALSIPLYLTLFIGIVEAGHYLLLNLKAQHTVVAIADLVTRDEEISEATMQDIFSAVPQIIAPYNDPADVVAIVSSVSQTSAIPASVFWQRIGGGRLVKTSRFGEEGDPASLPSEFTMRDNETIIATEIFYSYEPIMFNFLPSRTIRKVSYFRPRLGALQEITS
ncbi:TadE/TadG family type IV pilus assembly protein [Kordiimonas laminariae]|uniref:TadE/TadG family type IV pilus assembly protein n=1 Tax=Kordiimonas laminariae TaxID=2917717 RepID=UPI001FF4202C|nr:TadE family protein [Kordiimonas laminariae]MCK0068193.1 pilus assembly protein [Kordiimonas laminariae]